MKIYFIIIFIVLNICRFAAAEKLPDGTVVDSSNIEYAQKKDLEYTFKNPVNLKTPFGMLPVIYAAFNYDGSVRYIWFAEKQMIESPVGRIYAKRVGFTTLDSKNYVGEIYLGDSFRIKIPAGDLVLGEYDILKFDCYGYMYWITIEHTRTRELHTKYGVLKVEGGIKIDPGDESILDVKLSQPAEIATSAGRLTFTGNLYFKVKGDIHSGSLLKPQKISTPAGKAVINRITFNSDGSIFYCTLAEAAEMDTFWGRLRLTGQTRLSDNGKVADGNLESPQVINFSFGKVKVKGSFYLNYPEKTSFFYLAEDAAIITPFGTLDVTNNISIYENGMLAAFTPVNALTLNTSYGQFNPAAGSAIWVHPDGKIASFTISEPRIIDTHAGKLKVKGLTGFYSSGMIKSTTLPDKVSFNTAAGKCTVNEYIEFYPDGKLKFCTLVKSTTLKTPAGALKIRDCVDFHEDGSFKKGKLDAPVKIKGVTYRRGYIIEFDTKGDVISPKPGK